MGGFRVSFVTDAIQGAMVVGLIVLGVIAVGVETHIHRELIDSSGLTKASKVGWQLIYILPVAIFTNNFFVQVSHILCLSFSLSAFLLMKDLPSTDLHRFHFHLYKWSLRTGGRKV